jgi:mannose-6-phosphate isomerase-like protein (cupin superfamily)
MKIEKINLSEKFKLIDDYWNPKVVGELNGQMIKLVKLQGEFIWHKHEREDELFLITKGRLHIQFRDQTIEVGEGEMVIVPKGVEHKSSTQGVVEALIFEPASTINTGNVINEMTVNKLDQI